MINMATKIVKTPTKGIFKVVGVKGTTWKVDRQVKGQRITKTFASCEAAKTYLRRTRNQLMDGLVVDMSITLGNVAEKYLEDLKGRARANTYKQAVWAYNYYIKTFFPPNTKMVDITLPQIDRYERWLKRLPLSQGSKVLIIVATLKRIFNYAIKKGYARFNPTVAIEMSDGYKDCVVEVYTEEERRRLEEVTRVNVDRNYKTYLGFMFSIHAGLRIGEIVALRWCDIDFSNTKYPHGVIKVTQQYNEVEHRITNTKTKDSAAEVPMNYMLMQALITVKGMEKPDRETDYILHGKDKAEAMRPSSLRGDMVRVGKRLKIHVYPHKGRHTLAYELMGYGISEGQVSRVLRHSKGNSVTQKYYSGNGYNVSKETVKAMDEIYSNITTIHVVKNTGTEKETKIEIAK